MNKDEKKSLLKLLKRTKKLEILEYNWIIKIVILTFVISCFFSILSEAIIPNVDIIPGIIILVLFIFVGVLFDMIGVAVTSADIVPFNSMNSRKIKGADIAVLFKQHAEKVSSFCNDVVGDICGIISGTSSSIIAINLASLIHANKFYVILFVTSSVAALTIGGKAIGKSIAINNSNTILYDTAKIVSKFYKIKK